jgi:hypothetical protein
MVLHTELCGTQHTIPGIMDAKTRFCVGEAACTIRLVTPKNGVAFFQVTETSGGPVTRYRGVHTAIRQCLIVGPDDVAPTQDDIDETHPLVGCRGRGDGFSPSQFARLALYRHGVTRLPRTVGLALADALEARVAGTTCDDGDTVHDPGARDAAAVCAALTSQGLTLWRAEPGVRSRHLALATRLDVLAFEEDTGRLVVVEVKQCVGVAYCSHADTWFVGHKEMRHPLEGVRDTPLTRACVQAWLGAAVLRLDYGLSSAQVTWMVVVYRGEGVPCEVRRPSSMDVLGLDDRRLAALVAAMGRK